MNGTMNPSDDSAVAETQQDMISIPTEREARENSPDAGAGDAVPAFPPYREAGSAEYIDKGRVMAYPPRRSIEGAMPPSAPPYAVLPPNDLARYETTRLGSERDQSVPEMSSTKAETLPHPLVRRVIWEASVYEVDAPNTGAKFTGETTYDYILDEIPGEEGEPPRRTHPLWLTTILNEAEVRSWFRIPFEAGQTLLEAWYQSRPPLLNHEFDQSGINALRENKGGYTNRIVCRLAGASGQHDSGNLLWFTERVLVEPVPGREGRGNRAWNLYGVSIVEQDIAALDEAALPRDYLGGPNLPEGGAERIAELGKRMGVGATMPSVQAFAMLQSQPFAVSDPNTNMGPDAVPGTAQNDPLPHPYLRDTTASVVLSDDILKAPQLYETADSVEAFLVAPDRRSADVRDTRIFWVALVEEYLFDTQQGPLLSGTFFDDERQTVLHWIIRFPNEARVREWLPLPLRPDLPLNEALYRLRTLESQQEADHVVVSALKRGLRRYAQRTAHHLDGRDVYNPDHTPVRQDPRVLYLDEYVVIEPIPDRMELGNRAWVLRGMMTPVITVEQVQWNKPFLGQYVQDAEGNRRPPEYLPDPLNDPTQPRTDGLPAGYAARMAQVTPDDLVSNNIFSDIALEGSAQRDLERMFGLPRFPRPTLTDFLDPDARRVEADEAFPPAPQEEMLPNDSHSEIATGEEESSASNEPASREQQKEQHFVQDDLHYTEYRVDALAQGIVWEATVQEVALDATQQSTRANVILLDEELKTTALWLGDILNEAAILSWLPIPLLPNRPVAHSLAYSRVPSNLVAGTHVTLQALREEWSEYTFPAVYRRGIAEVPVPETERRQNQIQSKPGDRRDLSSGMTNTAPRTLTGGDRRRPGGSPTIVLDDNPETFLWMQEVVRITPVASRRERGNRAWNLYGVTRLMLEQPTPELVEMAFGIAAQDNEDNDAGDTMNNEEPTTNAEQRRSRLAQGASVSIESLEAYALPPEARTARPEMLLWEATVHEFALPESLVADYAGEWFDEERQTCLYWVIQITDEASALRWLPLARPDKQTLVDSWYWSRTDECRTENDLTAVTSLREGASGYNNRITLRLAGADNQPDPDKLLTLEERVVVEIIPGRDEPGSRAWNLYGIARPL